MALWEPTAGRDRITKARRRDTPAPAPAITCPQPTELPAPKEGPALLPLPLPAPKNHWSHRTTVEAQMLAAQAHAISPHCPQLALARPTGIL